jgi:hypothetical protein
MYDERGSDNEPSYTNVGCKENMDKLKKIIGDIWD